MAHTDEIMRKLACGASIEMNVQDVRDLDASRAWLADGQTLYVSHLPRQTWMQTAAACHAIRDAGLRAVPHVPVRLIDGASTLDRMLAELIGRARVDEILLIAGDYAGVAGPYSCVADVLATGALTHHGLTRISFAGHPEGHPRVPLAEIRRAEREKAALAAAAGLEVTFLTQFFFEAAPFLDWSAELRAHGVRGRIVAGLCAPAPLATLFRYAVRCGVGPSIRALGARPSSMLKLARPYAPDAVLHALAQARAHRAAAFDGVHWFCFGGFLKTCEWVDALAKGR